MTARTRRTHEPATTHSHLPALDALRALGALMVVSTHVGFESGDAQNGPFAGLLARMDFGVAIFFVLSGFLLFGPHARAWCESRSRPRTATYLSRRCWRVLPALWLTVLGTTVLLTPTGAGPADYLAHAALLQIYLPVQHLEGLTQMWSLSTEWAYYLVLPLMAWGLLRGGVSRRRLTVVAAALLLTPVIGAVWVFVSRGEERAVWLPGLVGWFGLGMLLALWRAARERGLARRGWLDELADHPLTTWSLAGALFLLLTTPVAGPYDLSTAGAGAVVVKNLGYAVCAALVLLPAASPGAAHHRAVVALEARPVRFLGEISYGIFCYHLIVLELVQDALGTTLFDASFWLLWAPTVAVTVVVAAVSYRWVERPLVRRGRSLERYRPLADVTAGVTTSATARTTRP